MKAFSAIVPTVLSRRLKPSSQTFPDYAKNCTWHAMKMAEDQKEEPAHAPTLPKASRPHRSLSRNAHGNTRDVVAPAGFIRGRNQSLAELIERFALAQHPGQLLVTEFTR